MANIQTTAGSGQTILADTITAGSLGSGLVSLVKIVDGTLGGNSLAAVDANGLSVSIKASVAQAGTSALNSQVDGHSATIGITTGAKVITDATGTLQQYLRGLVNWAYTLMPAALGQGTMAQSLRVVLPSDQSALPAQGAAAHGATLSGNPLRNGAVGINVEQAAILSGSTVNLIADVYGRQVIAPYQFYENATDGLTAAIADTGNYTIIAAAGSGIRNYLTEFSASNSNGVATFLQLKDGSTVRRKVYLPASSNIELTFPFPLRGSANTAWVATAETTGGSIVANASGFTGR
jgi:hypothetical protein